MVNKSLQPQEIQVWYIIPALRKELTLEMKKLGLDQKTIAKIIGVTEAAVSQYISEKRANEVKFDEKTKEEIKKSAQLISQNGKLLFQEMQHLLNKALENKVMCNVCHSMNELPEDCEICFKNEPEKDEQKNLSGQCSCNSSGQCCQKRDAAI